MAVISALFGQPLFTIFGGIIIVDVASTADFSLDSCLVHFSFAVVYFPFSVTESFLEY